VTSPVAPDPVKPHPTGPRWLPWAAALLTAALVAAIRWSVGGATFIHDEDAYVLQAQLFAEGAASAPARPVPDAFEQFYVLGAPRTVAKYYPGQGLTLAPFEALHVRSALPPLTAGAAAFVLVRIAAAVAGPVPALAAWAGWLAGDKVLTWHSTLLSQPTSTLCWLLAIAAALAWHRAPSRRALLVIAAAVGWDAITRPWSAVLLALPLGAWLSWHLTQRHLWRSTWAPLALGTAIVAIVPLFNRAVTGHAGTSPLSVYTATTMPYDRLGFGHGEPPPRALPEDQVAFHRVMRDSFAEFVPRRAGPLAFKRTVRIAEIIGGTPWRAPLVLAAIVSAFLYAGALARTLGALALTLHVGYSAYAFAFSWNGYDLEAAPLWAIVVALGLAAASRRLMPRHPTAAGVVPLAYFGLSLADAATAAPRAAEYFRFETTIGRNFRAAVASLAPAHPEGMVVYVRYANGHDVHRSVVVNPPFSAREPVWIVHANPATNREVLAAAGQRTPVFAQELPSGGWRVEVAPRPTN
jgi:hypothetical protein